MYEIDFFMVDAFSDRAFGGNAAAVCLLKEWPADDLLLKMAQQHNQSETAFIVKQPGGFALHKVSVTAKGDGAYDFVSRFFSPGEAVWEDPVTGSAHTMLIPYWGAKLGKTQMLARQVSARGGDVRCEWQGERVLMSGKARTYLQGKVFLD